MTDTPRPPPRFEQPGLLAFAAHVAVIAFFVVALSGTQASRGDLASGLPQMARLVGEMLPRPPPGWARSPGRCWRPSRWRLSAR